MERKPFNSYVLAVILISIGLLLFVTVVTYDHARTWTDLTEGLLNGLIHSVLCSIAYFVVFVPLICLLIFVTRNRPVSFWPRSTLCLLPLLIILGLTIFNWIANPITDRNCFELTMGFKMPSSATNIYAERFGGGLTDISDTYCFLADSNEIQQMLTGKPFERTDDAPWETPAGWPDPNNWGGVITYQYNDGPWDYSIQTDDDYTQAIVSASCI